MTGNKNYLFKAKSITDKQQWIDLFKLYTKHPIAQSTSITTLIKDLLHRNVIKDASINTFGKHIESLNNNKSLMLCKIIPNKIINAETFEFNFELLFGPYQRLISHIENKTEEKQFNTFANFDTNCFEKIYYHYGFNATTAQIKLIHDAMTKAISSGKEFFARKPYPKPHEKATREKIIEDEMKEEIKYLLAPNLPKGKTLFHTKANLTDLNNHCGYLQKLFCCAPFCVEEYMFEILCIDPALKKLIQHKANSKLKTLQNIANKEFIINPFKLTKKKGHRFNFHSLYITHRPLKVTDNNLSPISFDHWAIKFEGNKNLLTVDFFDDMSKDHGIVKMRMLPNTRLNRRIWWYWWERDEQKESKSEFFTKRWGVLWTVWLKSLSAQCIGRLIIRWLRTNDYAIYNVAKNNCQHFVRDIVAAFDVSTSKRLNSLFDHQVIGAVLPGVTVVDGMTEELRMWKIRDILTDEINQYKTDRQFKQLQKKDVNLKKISSGNDVSNEEENSLQNIILKRGLEIANFQLCDAFFVKDDKQKIIRYLNDSIDNEKWSEHLKIMKEYILSPKNMDVEQILKHIKSMENMRDTALMKKLIEKSDADQFVRILELIFKEFELED
eukprot:250210_1